MPENQGNTIGNLRNLGVITNDNYYIYYMAVIGSESFLNRRSIGSGESRAIGAGDFLYLNVVDGFIYYADGTSNKIYRMTIDGEQNERLSETRVNFLFVLDGTIYALGSDSFAMNLDGTNVRILSDNSIHDIYFYDNEIYYATIINGRTLLYRMELTGENRELIFQGNMGRNFFVYKGNIYYIEALGPGGGSIRKFDDSTQEFFTVHSIDRTMPGELVNRKDNILFYMTFGMPSMPLASPWTFHWIDLNTGEANSTDSADAILLHVIGDRIFFYDRETNEQIYMMNFDGSDVERFH